MKKSIFTSMALCVLLVFTTEAEVPQLINYQGVLSDSAGASLDGTFDITFKLYSQPVSGTEFWTETHSGAAVNDGLFAVILGSVTPFGAAKSTSHEIWLGITIGTDPELSPRSQLISVPFAFNADRADTAEYAQNANSSVHSDSSFFADDAGQAIYADTSDYAGNSLRADTAEVAKSATNNSIGSAQLIDNNVTSQDIEDSTILGVDIAKNTIRGTHLQLGAVNSEKIADGSILEADLSFDPATQPELNTHQSNSSAHHTKTTDASELTSGTVDDARLSSNVPLENTTNTFSNTNTYNGTLEIGDSTFRADNTGINIGNSNSPADSALLQVQRRHNTTNRRAGIYVVTGNDDIGHVYGVRTRIVTEGGAHGMQSIVFSNGNSRFGVQGFSIASGSNNNLGTNYGVLGEASSGAVAYGIYGTASSATTNWAGYFAGDVHATGTLSKGGGSFRIDHPLDPENKYLQHSFVESPDMMNVYNGNIVTDADGFATVTLPDYFEILNKDFRYQLTVIGEFAQAIVAEKVSGNWFVIRTSVPNVEVSWQVTGIRKDKWAEANRIQVEMDKPEIEKGYYMHYKEWNQPVEKAIDREALLNSQKLLDENN